MSLNYRHSGLLLLLLLGAAPLGARPRVMVKLAVELPSAVRLAPVEQLQAELAGATVTRLRERFCFLDWQLGGAADRNLLVEIVTDPESPRPESARPWIVRLTLDSAPHPLVLPLVSAVEAHNLGDDARASLSAFYKSRILSHLDGDADPDHLVKVLLSTIEVANDIKALTSHLAVKIPATDLHATDDSRLDAKFVFGPEGAEAEHATLVLSLSGTTNVWGDRYPECAVVAPPQGFELAKQRRGDAHVHFIEYHYDCGTEKVGGQFRVPACKP